MKKSLFFLFFLLPLFPAKGGTFKIASEQTCPQPTTYPERVLEKALKEIAEEKGYSFASASQGWIIEIQKPQAKALRIFGYNFPLNDSVTYSLCNDKSALSLMLQKEGVAHIPHTLYLNPSLKKYADPKGSWSAMQDELAQNPSGIVLKKKDGTGGSGIFRVKNRVELEAAAVRLFAKGGDVCVSPLINDAEEFRVVLLDKVPQLVLAKERLFVQGDGQSNLGELCVQKKIPLESLKKSDIDLTNIPSSEEIVRLNWQHNLGQGAEPRILLSSDPLYDDLTKVASEASDAVNLRFGSVDIMRAEDQKMKVLEINSGVMMENTANFLDKQQEGSGFALVKGIYAKAVDTFFDGARTEEKKALV